MYNQSHRFIGTACFAVAAFIFAVIATNSPVVTEDYYSNVVNSTSNLIEIGLFKTCNTSILQGVDYRVCQPDSDLDFNCASLKIRFRAGRAFSVLSSLALGVVAVIAFARMVYHFPLIHAIHKSFFALSAVSAFVSLIAFPVVISVYTTSFCQFPAYVTDPSYGLGSSGEWMSLAFGFTIVSMIFEFRTRPSAADMIALEVTEQRVHGGADADADAVNNVVGNTATGMAYGAAT